MPNNLSGAVSPYLRSHADNPVDWQPWGSAAFAEAAERDVPVLISIGYSTCHWCHVMARETFSDPELAAYLNANFVSIKVDREEHPDVDSSYLTAAGAFTEQLGWPLNVFATPAGRTFFAGTYFPPVATAGHPAFREVLGAIRDAWTGHRDEVEETARQVAGLLGGGGASGAASVGGDPTDGAHTGGASVHNPVAELVDAPAVEPWPDFDELVAHLEHYEDRVNGGFGTAPKFPVAPVLGFLLDRRSDLGRRTLAAMASSDLRDRVEGGFFRYSTRPDWSEPHYERMLYDNALLLDLYARAGFGEVADGIASFLLRVLRLDSGGFASAQDSESTVDGVRVEGGYYALDAPARLRQSPPALDEKVLTGWNGLAIGALASAGNRLGRTDWVEAAIVAADLVSAEPLVRARLGDRTSRAAPTLEDFGMLADGLVKLALATGEPRFAVRARQLVDGTLARAGSVVPFFVPSDSVLAEHGLALEIDPSEGAYPSGLSAMAGAALALHSLGAGARYRDAAASAMRVVAPLAAERPMSFGRALGVMSVLAAPDRELLVVGDAGSRLAGVARAWAGAATAGTSGGTSVSVTAEQAERWAAAGFELFESRGMLGGEATAYLCEDFVCRLPVTTVDQLERLLAN